MRTLAFIALAALSGCASTEMRPYVGKPIEEAFISYGRPENVFDLPGGTRAFQFRWGGGQGVIPGQAITTVTTTGSLTTARTAGTPPIIYDAPGCLITFIARDSGAGYIVEEYRVPKQLTC